MKRCIQNHLYILLFIIILSAAGAPIMISSIEGLQAIGIDAAHPLGGHYILTQNIDASETSGWDLGEGFLNPFTAFKLLFPAYLTEQVSKSPPFLLMIPREITSGFSESLMKVP